MTPEQVKEQEKLQEHIYKTYYGLRNGFFAIAILFPVLLAVIGWWNHIQLQGSMSAYYFAFAPPESPLRVFPARAVFVGFLFYAWDLFNFVQRVLKAGRLVVEHSGCSRCRCRAGSNADAARLQQLWEQHICLCTRVSWCCWLCLHRFCCFVL
jgi:hypothetical protein